MSLIGWVYILICSGIVVSANILLRTGVVHSNLVLFGNGLRGLPKDIIAVAVNPLLVASVILYALSMLIWFRLVATEPISFAYPLLASFTFVGITIAGVVFFQEPMSTLKVVGLFFALLGCVLLSLSNTE